MFPLEWAREHGETAVLQRAAERIREVEGKTGLNLVPGSVLRAFVNDEASPAYRTLFAPEVPRGIH